MMGKTAGVLVEAHRESRTAGKGPLEQWGHTFPDLEGFSSSSHASAFTGEASDLPTGM